MECYSGVSDPCNTQLIELIDDYNKFLVRHNREEDCILLERRTFEVYGSTVYSLKYMDTDETVFSSCKAEELLDVLIIKLLAEVASIYR
jgi:hypothetical protein